MKLYAEAPSNIALIKYMGKTDHQANKPTNSSLSFTLNHLVTAVELEVLDSEEDTWAPLLKGGFYSLELSEKGRNRFLKHLEFLKKHFGITKNFKVSSANNFPSDCGLASSASSFAALTLCAYEAAKVFGKDSAWVDSLRLEDLAELSRQGSGSSCRSFFSPFALWSERGVEQVSLPRGQWHHLGVLIEEGKKSVSSSEAHRLVTGSKLFQGRPERAEKRLQQLLEKLQLGDWERAYELCWQEFWDMHALFETSQPPFGYFSSDSFEVLNRVRRFWNKKKDGPLVTMDAGPNIHLLFREDQKAMLQEMQSEVLKGFHCRSSFGDPE